MKHIHPSVWYGRFLSHLGEFGIKVHYATIYLKQRHDIIHIKHPRNLAEYIVRNILDYDFNVMAAKYADKYAVREYVKSKGLDNNLLTVYGVWDNPEEINWDKLPNQFALKANNGCGEHVFCHDKSKLDKAQTVKRIKNAMLLKDLIFEFEPHYKLIRPKVYAEELMKLSSQSDIIDYKFMCSRGIIDSILMVYGRRSDHHYKLELRDEEWKPIDGLTPAYQKSPELEKPTHFDDMKTIARKLSEDFDFVRVDLYEYNNQVYFGELTFTPQGGQLEYFTTNYLTRIYQQIIKLKPQSTYRYLSKGR